MILKEKMGVSMKSNVLIGLMVFVWLVLMANIIWQGTDGKWYITDAEKIGKLEVAKYTNQIIAVTAKGHEATLCFYQKEENDTEEYLREGEKTEGVWKLVFETEVAIGKNGLGKTKEGDGKTPIGVFRFTKAFGILDNPGSKMEYIQVDERHYWVDDSASSYYNQFVNAEDVEKDWESAEHICEYGESYHYVLATSYNSECVPGAGSAVFLHCTSVESNATAGCIAIPEVYMKRLIREVEPQCMLIIDKAENLLSY